MRHWYLSLYMGGCSVYQSRIDTVSSHDDGHIGDRNMQRRENKYIKKYVHLVGLICK